MKPHENHGIPNVPVYHTSTIMKATLDDYRQRRGKYDYGRLGTPTSDAVESSVAGLYGSDDAVAVPSGLAAITTGVLAVVKSGERVLFPDSLYGSGRRFAEVVLPQIGVEPHFYDPLADVSAIAAMITDNTSLLYIETPGSLTFEMQDTTALVALAKQHGLLTACDNTWGTPFYFNAVGHGIDVIIEAGTKYISGHSDVSIGFVASSGETARRIRQYTVNIGLCVAPDDHYLALRGMRTMALRLRQSEANGLALARWIEQQPEVTAMLHPGLESHPQHGWWKRDFTGASGLFGFVLDKDIPDAAVDVMANDLCFFGIGASWGGHESLISEGHLKRSVTSLPDGRLMRIYAGLEDTDDLLADLAAGFERMRKAR
ncbi:cystathionine beta-lyase [Alphaproteobacteria bacterium LSUCC0684]